MAGDAQVLLVEDEPKLAEYLKLNLEENGFDVKIAFDGSIALKLFKANKFQIVLLDLNLPLVNGYELCKQFRTTSPNIPILILTALSDTDDKMQAFNLGADDYIVKPFEFRELLARIKVFLRRQSSTAALGSKLTVADLEIDTYSKTVSRGGTSIDLSAKEFNLLEYLVTHKGRVISKNELMEKVWDINFDTNTNVVEVYINFLRNKVDKNFQDKLILNKQGLGYYIKT